MPERNASRFNKRLNALFVGAKVSGNSIIPKYFKNSSDAMLYAKKIRLHVEGKKLESLLMLSFNDLVARICWKINNFIGEAIQVTPRYQNGDCKA